MSNENAANEPIQSPEEQALQQVRQAARAFIGTAADHRLLRLSLERLRARVSSDEDQLSDEHPEPLMAIRYLLDMISKTKANAESHEALENAIALLGQRTLTSQEYLSAFGREKPTSLNRKARRAAGAKARQTKSPTAPKLRRAK